MIIWRLSCQLKIDRRHDRKHNEYQVFSAASVRKWSKFGLVRSEMKALLLAATAVAVMAGANPAPTMAQVTTPVSQVVQWNRTLLVIVRTAGAQPATIHPTRSFAIMHAAIYDAVNALDGSHKPYSVHLTGISPSTSQDAAAAQAAHDVLVILYPKLQA